MPAITLWPALAAHKYCITWRHKRNNDKYPNQQRRQQPKTEVSQNDFIAVDATPEIHKQGDKCPSRIFILYSPPSQSVFALLLSATRR